MPLDWFTQCDSAISFAGSGTFVFFSLCLFMSVGFGFRSINTWDLQQFIISWYVARGQESSEWTLIKMSVAAMQLNVIDPLETVPPVMDAVFALKALDTIGSYSK